MTTRLDPTYEELKHPSGSFSAPTGACLDPTYEELKLSKNDKEVKNIKCLDPTYEELKPVVLEHSVVLCPCAFRSYL